MDFTFHSLPSTKWIQPGYIITNVVPGDYNYDGHLDVLLMGQESPEKSSEIQMQIYLGNGNDTFGKNENNIESGKLIYKNRISTDQVTFSTRCFTYCFGY